VQRSDAAKTRREAGATLPCHEVAARSLRASGVTPASCCGESQHVFCPQDESSSDRLHAAVHAARRQVRMLKGGRSLPILKVPPKKPKTASLQIRIEEDVSTTTRPLCRIHRRITVLRRDRSLGTTHNGGPLASNNLWNRGLRSACKRVPKVELACTSPHPRDALACSGDTAKGCPSPTWALRLGNNS
jgi:hypothetical protein